jgi:hypothetical protein
LIELAAADPIFFSRAFFPKTARQKSPWFHSQIWNLLETGGNPYVGIEVFRGGAKTTIVRLNLAKRISYSISRTILIVSASQSHAARSVRWLKSQVEKNATWANTFRLRKGNKWTDEEIEIVNGITGESTFVLAVGITGQIRGVNLEDYRPDFIVADDPCDEENSGTDEQLKKTAELFFGALAPGLAPRSECPNAMMVLLQTSISNKDLINTAHKDPQWRTFKFPIIVDKEGVKASAWPDRWTLEELVQMKESYTRRGQLYLWLREYECTITSPEEAPLKMDALRYYEVSPESMIVYFGLDPARPKSKNPHKSCLSAVGRVGRDVYLLEYFTQTNVNPDELWNSFYAMALRWRPFMVGVETIAYQQALAWYFRKKMVEVGVFWQVKEVEDRRRKADRIIQEIAGLASEGHLYVRPTQDEWIEAYRSWRVGEDQDLLDSTALAIALSGNLVLSVGDESAIPLLDESNIPDLQLELGCP